MGINLLTAEEQKTLRPILKIIQTISQNYELKTSNDADDDLNQRMNEDFESLCKKKRLSRKKLLDLSVQVLNSKWFSVYLSDGRIDSNGNPYPVFSFVTSDKPEEPKEITSAEYPDFFTISSRLPDAGKNQELLIMEYRDALNLPKDYKNLDVDFVDAVLTVYEIFGDNPRKITVRPLKKALILGDKVNALKLWGLSEKENKKNLFIPFNSASAKGKRVGIGLRINFDGVPANMTKSLTKFDKYVYSMLYTLYMAGYHNMTASMIYSMGSNSRPSQTDIQRINEALTKMGTIRVFVDNTKEREEYPSYPPFSYDEILLDFVRVAKMEVNGKISESAIHIKSEPIMGRFANERRQIRKVDMKLLNPPINKNESGLAITDYLLFIVTNPQQSTQKIKNETFFERVGATERKQKQRALKTAEKVLAYYKEQNEILDYSMETDGILIVKREPAENAVDKKSQVAHKK